MAKRGRPRKEELTEQEIRAIRYLLLGHTKRNSMLKAGYTPDQARWHDEFFGKRQLIKDEVSRRKNIMAEAFEITEDRIMQQMAKIAFADVGDVLEVDDEGKLDWNFKGKEGQIGAIVGGLQVFEGRDGKKQMKLSQKDQIAALKALAHWKGMDNITIKHNVDADLMERLNAARSQVLSAEDGDDSVGGGGTS